MLTISGINMSVSVFQRSRRISDIAVMAPPTVLRLGLAARIAGCSAFGRKVLVGQGLTLEEPRRRLTEV